MALPSDDIQHSLRNEEFKNWKGSAIEEHRILFSVISAFGFVITLLFKFELNQRNILLMRLFVVIILAYGASFVVMLRHTTYSRPDLNAFLHNISFFIGTLAFVPEALVLFSLLGWALLALWGIWLVYYLILKLVQLKRRGVIGGAANTSIRNNEGDDSSASAGDPSELDQNLKSPEEHAISIRVDSPDEISYE